MQRLINQLSKLPTIGQKSAQRLAYHIIGMSEDQVRELSVSIYDAKKKVHFCPVCGNYTDVDPCALCADPDRDKRAICIVKDPRDVAALERMRDYQGQYHVLHGVISPMDNIGPENIRIRELMQRLSSEPIDELILATSPNIEGEATATYLARLLKPLGVKVTRLAYGIPIGGNLEYADEITLYRALEGRREI